MNKRTISILVMSAGMAWVGGCSDWQHDTRADADHRTKMDQEARARADARADRAATTTTGTTASTTPGVTTSTTTRTADGRTVPTSDAHRDGRDAATLAGASTSTGASGVPEKDLTGEVHDHDLTARTRPDTSTTGTTTARTDGTQTQTVAARDQSARDQSAREQASRDQMARDQAERDRAARDQMARTDRVTTTDGRTTTTTTSDGRVVTSTTPTTTQTTKTADGRTVTTTTDGRTVTTTRDGRVVQDQAQRGPTPESGRTDYTMNSDQRSQTDSRITSADRREIDRTTAEDPYGGSPDAFGSSPYSPANRGVRVTQYDRRGLEPLHRETNWQEPGGVVTTAAWTTEPYVRSESTTWRQTDDMNQPQTTAIDATSPARAGDPNRPVDAALVGVSGDSRILSLLHAKNEKEIEMGRLAQSKGTSPEIRAYGAELVKDHTEADRQLQSLASSRQIMLMDAEQVKVMMQRDQDKIKTSDGYADRHERSQSVGDAQPMKDQKEAKDWQDPAQAAKKDHMEYLKGLSGSEFDKAFAEKMLKGHRELIGKVESARDQVTPEVAEFLDKTLTTLRKHEKTAERLAASR